MSKLCKFTVRLAAASVIALASAGAALADPPGMLSTPGLHRHFLVTPNEVWVPIGPDVCADSNLQEAFNQFHHNIHHSTGATDTLGPQDGAPGLHDGLGADMDALRGCV